jgi:hypothetical protein
VFQRVWLAPVGDWGTGDSCRGPDWHVVTVIVTMESAIEATNYSIARGNFASLEFRVSRLGTIIHL